MGVIDSRSRLETVLLAARTVLTADETDGALASIARHARGLASAALAAVALPDGDATFVVSAADGAAAMRVVGARLPAELFRVRAEAESQLAAALGVGPLVLVPLSTGALLVANLPGDSGLTAEDQAAVELLVAATAGVAPDQTARSLLAGRRTRIATELYDRVVPRLFGVGLSLQHTAGLAKDAAVRSRLERDIADLDRTVADLRSAVFGLFADRTPT